jgi:hypothetical protein
MSQNIIISLQATFQYNSPETECHFQVVSTYASWLDADFSMLFHWPFLENALILPKIMLRLLPPTPFLFIIH